MTTTKTMTDAQGQQVPLAYVKPYDRLRDKTARRILARWQKAHAALQRVKAETLEDIAALQAAASGDADQGGLGGEKGNIQFRSFDGLITVRVDARTNIEFDERIREAHAIIQKVVAELASATGQADIAEIINAAFRPSSFGLLQKSRILGLLRLKVKHADWARAMELIKESIFTKQGKSYIYVEEKAARDAEAIGIVLDIAAIGLDKKPAEEHKEAATAD